MEDKKLICVDCGNEFVFTVGEQEFYNEKGFENEPKRCPDCRRAKKQQTTEDSFKMLITGYKKVISYSLFLYYKTIS